MMDKARHYLPAWLAVGLMAGLFLVRIVAEATRAPWSPLALATLVVVLCAALAFLLRWLNRRGIALPLAPMLVLLVYALWPQRDWRVALVVVSIALLAWLIGASSRTLALALSARVTHHASRITHHASRSSLLSPLSSLLAFRSSFLTPRSSLIDLLTFLITLTVYLGALQKDVLPADSGEFQVAVTMLGILHQPGFPLYTLVGKLFALLPVGAPAFNLNLMSAFLAAGTLTLVGATVRRLLGESWGAVWGSLAAVLALGTATTFWAQATTANIRMPTAFFTAWCLYLLIAFRSSLIAYRSSLIADRCLAFFALAFSLGLGHYFALGAIGLFFVAYLVLADPALMRQPRRWRRPLLVFVLAQLVWLYLPIRAAIAPTPDTRGLTSLNGFLWYALGEGFAGDKLAFAGTQYLPARLAILPTLFSFQMNLVLLAAALVGAVMLIWRDWRAALMLVGGFLLHTFITITYRAPQTVEYEMPAYVLLAVMIGCGVGQISNLQSPISNLQSKALHVIAAGIIVAGLANGAAHAPSFIALASDRSTREYVEPILRDAPSGSIILSDWHYFTPMRYLQQVEGLRPDVEVYDVFPVGGQEISQVWRSRIEENLALRPVIVLHYWGLQYSTMPYIFEPFKQAWLMRAKPSFEAPRDLVPMRADFEDKIRLVAYRASLARASPGQSLDVTLAWQVLGRLDRDYSLTVQLTDEQGARRTQRDRGYPTRTFAPGEVRVDRFTLPLEPTLRPGRYAIKVGVYYAPPEGGFRNLMTADGAQLATVATLDLVAGQDTLPSLHPLDAPFVGGPTLTGVDYDLSVPSSLRVYLHWRGPSPPGVSVRVGDTVVQLPELPRGATFVTGHDLVTTSLRLSVTGADGHAMTGVGAWGWPVSEIQPPAFHPGDRYVMLSDQMALIGVESPEREILPGQPIDVRLRFLSLKPLVTGNVMSVRVDGENVAWRVASDDRPAANAIPTLKWIAGSVVDDRRRLIAPADARPGRASGHLTVYDEFREEVLPPLDARMGDSVPLGEWRVEGGE